MSKKKSTKKANSNSSQNKKRDNSLQARQKLLQQENLRKELRKRKLLKKIKIAFALLCLIGIITAIILYDNSQKIDYNLGINEDGTLANINIETAIISDYTAISFNKEDIKPSDDIIDTAIEDLLKAHGTLNTESSDIINEGDTVNIIFTASSNKEVINSSTPETGGTDVTIGLGTFDTSVESLLPGHKVGDTFNASISHPSEESDPSSTGENILYNITIQGIYEYPEFNDEFVSTYCSDVASTVEEYKEILSKNYYEDNLINAINDSISTNSVVTEYPTEYINNLVKIAKSNDKQRFNESKKMYKEFGIIPNEIYELYGLSSQSEYEDKLLYDAQEKARKTLFCQNVMIHEGMTNTREEVKEYFFKNGVDEASFEKAVNESGYNYVANQALIGRVIYHLKDIVNINE